MKRFAVACGISLLLAASVWASDKLVQSITTVAGVANCVGPLGPNRYAVQCQGCAVHVAAATSFDGGGSSLLGSTADTKSVLVNSSVLYDVELEGNVQPYICVMGQDGGAVTAQVYLRSVWGRQ